MADTGKILSNKILEFLVIIQTHTENHIELALSPLGMTQQTLDIIKPKVNAAKQKANRELSDAFKRVILYEIANYLSSSEGRRPRYWGIAYTAESIQAQQFLDQGLGDVPDEIMPVQSAVAIPQLECAKKKVLEASDYSDAYRTISDIVSRINYFNGPNQFQSPLLGYAPQNYADTISLDFGGLSCAFVINDSGQYEGERQRNAAFKDFTNKIQDLFNPSAGYLRLGNFGSQDYVLDFLKRFFTNHKLVSPSEVSIEKKPSLEYFVRTK